MSPTIEDAQYEVLSAISELYTTGLASDLQIKCGDSTFNVHKAIVGARSPVLRKACTQGTWKESLDGILVIGNPSSDDGSDPSDDPIAVDLMLQFIYRGDYDPGPPLCEPSTGMGNSNTGLEGDISDSTKAETVEDHVHNPFNPSRNHRVSHPSQEDDGLEMNSGVLNLHAKLYALGDKYDMPTLMGRALDKFKDDANQLEWDDEAFCTATTTVFTTTPGHSTGLRHLVIEILHRHARRTGLSYILETYISETPELSFGLWKRSLPEVKPRPIPSRVPSFP